MKTDLPCLSQIPLPSESRNFWQQREVFVQWPHSSVGVDTVVREEKTSNKHLPHGLERWLPSFLSLYTFTVAMAGRRRLHHNGQCLSVLWGRKWEDTTVELIVIHIFEAWISASATYWLTYLLKYGLPVFETNEAYSLSRLQSLEVLPMPKCLFASHRNQFATHEARVRLPPTFVSIIDRRITLLPLLLMKEHSTLKEENVSFP
jgi:hypothetical protein